MKLIPVIDLMAGQVVHARHGEREKYQPIRSTLCPSSAPEAILQALIARFECDIVYLADLDAIRFGRPQIETIAQLKLRFPALQFWLDSGIADYASLVSLNQRDIAIPVIGSESLTDIDWLTPLEKHAWILSLDFKQSEFLGPPQILANDANWPSRVVAMNLNRVGSNLGPDFQLLETLRQRQPNCEIYAAGGVRNHADLIELYRRGIAGALVATALHNGSVKPIAQDSFK
jgi:phosphoribosylformimino-5-aminoimidazole carboxamide ribotide isomerase